MSIEKYFKFKTPSMMSDDLDILCNLLYFIIYYVARYFYPSFCLFVCIILIQEREREMRRYAAGDFIILRIKF